MPGQELAQALQVLREDRAGIATRAVQGRVGSSAQQFTGMAGAGDREALPDGREGQREIGARVPVGDRVDVDAVQVPALTDEAGNAAEEQPLKAAAVQVGHAEGKALHFRDSVNRLP